MHDAVVSRRTLILHLRCFFLQTKPRVNALIVFTAMIGMLLAQPGLPPGETLLLASLGIALVSGAAAACNCVIEQRIDATMARTRGRPLPQGQVSAAETLWLAFGVGGLGLALLWHATNALTAVLTLATFLGYAVVYTVYLKPATPMNIVYGGAAGAMPPVLGWAAMQGSVSFQALSLFLVIFLWTPPHFWPLALQRREEYARSGLPMLPVTHGIPHTCREIRRYTLWLTAASLLPVAVQLAGPFYLGFVLPLDLGFIRHARALEANYSDEQAQRTFRYSICYLTALFAALLADHYLGGGGL